MNRRDERLFLLAKTHGRCGYCGCELQGGWHVDHIEPIRRNGEGVDHPERDTVENKIASCPSCNMMKSVFSVEQFRENIKNFINSLNLYSNQYKFAKKYGIVMETEKPVVFYFEKVEEAKDD